MRHLSTGCFRTTSKLPHSLHWEKMSYTVRAASRTIRGLPPTGYPGGGPGKGAQHRRVCCPRALGQVLRAIRDGSSGAQTESIKVRLASRHLPTGGSPPNRSPDSSLKRLPALRIRKRPEHRNALYGAHWRFLCANVGNFLSFRVKTSAFSEIFPKRFSFFD